MSERAPDGFTSFWNSVVADMEATAEEYREDGWEVLTLHVGDATPLPSGNPGGDEERVGVDLMVGGDEFRELEAVVEGADFDEFEAYRAESAGTVFAVLAMRDTDAKRAVLLPAYYRRADCDALLAALADGEPFHTYVRPLSDDRRVVFEQADPELLFPEEWVEGR